MRVTTLIGMLVFISALGLVHAAPVTHAVIAEVQAALDKGDAQHAASLADTALKDETGAAERGRLLLYRGLAQELLGRHDDAMTDFSRALATRALPPEEREQALLQRGFLRDGLGRLDEAVADYTAAAALKDESAATAINNRANIYRRQNRLADAKRDYQAALAMVGGRPQYSWYGLGQIAEAQNDLVAARGFYAKAVALDSGYALASERLAALGGPPDDAIAGPDVIVLHPPHPRGQAQTAPAGPAEKGTTGPDTIILHPPRSARAVQRVAVVATTVSRAADGSVILGARPVSTAAPKAQGESVVLRPPRPRASAARPANPILRPALDAPQGRAGGEVQLGAWRSEAEARDGWAKARSRAGGALEGLSPDIVTADLPGKGRYYRLRVTPMAGQGRSQFCAALTVQGVACLPVRD